MDFFPGLLNINLNWWSSIRDRRKDTPSTIMGPRMVDNHSSIDQVLILYHKILLLEKGMENQRTLLSWLIHPMNPPVTCIHSRNRSKGILVVAGKIWYLLLVSLVHPPDSFVSDHCLLKPGFTWSHSNHKKEEEGRRRKKKKWMKWQLQPTSFLNQKRWKEFYPFLFPSSFLLFLETLLVIRFLLKHIISSIIFREGKERRKRWRREGKRSRMKRKCNRMDLGRSKNDSLLSNFLLMCPAFTTSVFHFTSFIFCLSSFFSSITASSDHQGTNSRKKERTFLTKI